MTPEENDLISNLFERMRRQGLAEIDEEAAQLIARSMRANPDAAYQLVQTVIVQNMALERAEQKIADLEDEVRAASSRPARSSGSFLGGIFGGGRDAGADAAPARQDVDSRRSAMGSVPGAGSRINREAADSSPWNAARAPTPLPERGARGGGFLGNAMTTAAGVAGGMLLADGIRGLFKDDASAAHAADASKTAETPAAHESAGGESGASETTEASNTELGGGGFFDGLFGGGGGGGGDGGDDDLLDI